MALEPAPGWPEGTSLDTLNARSDGTLMASLGIVFTELGDGYLRATMPVDARTRQPAGVLHGGVSVVLADAVITAADLPDLLKKLDGRKLTLQGREITLKTQGAQLQAYEPDWRNREYYLKNYGYKPDRS